MEENILFHITPEQARKICEIKGLDFDTIEEYEICSALDEIIDSISFCDDHSCNCCDC